MEPYNDMVEQVLSNLHSELVNPDPFGQQGMMMFNQSLLVIIY